MRKPKAIARTRRSHQVTKQEPEQKGKTKIDKTFLERGARTIKEEDVEKVVNKADVIKKKVARSGPLARFIQDVELLVALIRDVYSGRYRRIPYWAVSAVVFTLLYIFNPFDLIPDMIPVVGLLDDAAVLSVCLVLVEQELHEYRDWRNRSDS